MQILKERTRLLISDFTSNERKAIEDMVASLDNVYMYYDPDENVIGLPTGMEKHLKNTFKSIKFTDRSSQYWEYEKITPVDHNAKPRNQLQVDFINFVLEKSKDKQKLAGILSPGTGKTFMACYAAIRVGLRTLIVVPTSGIKQQWADTLTGMFNVPEERINIVNKPSDFILGRKDFTIVTHATLASINKRYKLNDIMKHCKFGIKVIDEVQMFFKNIVIIDACSNIANNWYLTGTFGRSGETENSIYQEMFGDLAIFREKEKKPTLFNRKPGNVYGMKPHMHITMVWGHSGLSKEEIELVTDSMRYSEREGKWVRYGLSVPKYMNLIIPKDGTMTKFLKLVLKVVKKAESQVSYGKTLILGSTIAGAEIVAGYVQKMYPDKVVRTYHSRHSKEENEKNKAECDILVSTVSSAGTGFDIKDLSKLIVYTPFKSWILADQVSGRLRRRPDGKDTYMWDVVDADIKQIRVWANARVDVYRRKSKSFKVVDM